MRMKTESGQGSASKGQEVSEVDTGRDLLSGFPDQPPATRGLPELCCTESPLCGCVWSGTVSVLEDAGAFEVLKEYLQMVSRRTTFL